MKNLILASTSTVFGGNFLDYLLPELEKLFKNASTILFIPYAQPSGISYDEYTYKASVAFAKINKKVVGLHTFKDKKKALKKAEAIFTGGGNTFLLVTKLYKENIMTTLAEVLKNGTPYLGTSAGSNICGLTMMATNDMPIVYPPSFRTLGMLPFDINPHYIDPDKNSTHMGETRATRIKELHSFNSQPVMGLREGSWLAVKGKEIIVKGKHSARWFTPNATAREILPNTTRELTLI